MKPRPCVLVLDLVVITSIMDTDVFIGTVIASVALLIIVALVWWSRRTINRIERRGYRTARQTLKELNDGE
jgi:hypothetical protein